MSKALTVRLSDEAFAKLHEMAKNDLRTVGKTIEFLVREHFHHSESLDEYYEREKPYIDHALKQEGVPMKFEDVFRKSSAK